MLRPLGFGRALVPVRHYCMVEIQHITSVWATPFWVAWSYHCIPPSLELVVCLESCVVRAFVGAAFVVACVACSREGWSVRVFKYLYLPICGLQGPSSAL